MWLSTSQAFLFNPLSLFSDRENKQTKSVLIAITGLKKKSYGSELHDDRACLAPLAFLAAC